MGQEEHGPLHRNSSASCSSRWPGARLVCRQPLVWVGQTPRLLGSHRGPRTPTSASKCTCSLHFLTDPIANVSDIFKFHFSPKCVLV